MEHTTIGIDLGHCETALALPRQVDGSDSRYEVRRLVGENKDQVIMTQIILTDDQMKKLSGKLRPTYTELCQLGDIKIGNKLPAYVLSGEKFCYFKVPPKEFDKQYGNSEVAKKYKITHGQIMACYAFALVNSIFKYNIEDLRNAKREDVVLLIGCPTTKDWIDDEAQSAYAKLVKLATNVKDVKIVPESRAAMFSSIENGKNQISAIKGAVVFDFGSSTADCTYMLMGRKLIEFSWTLGASEIERQMALEAYQTAVKDQGMFEVKTISFADVEGELRVAKEAYYDHQYGPKGHAMICGFESSDDGEVIDATIRVNDAFMNKIAGVNSIQILCDSKISQKGTWKSLCEDFFKEAKKRIESSSYSLIDSNGKIMFCNCEIEVVVLTGGASKMDFIYELCQKVFAGTTIRREDNPSHAVSNGLGWVAISDSNFNTCLEAARSEIKSKPACNIKVLRNNLSDIVFNKICNIIEKETKTWAETPGDELTARDLDNGIKAGLNNPRTKKELTNACEMAINDWKSVLSHSLVTSVNNQVMKLYTETIARGVVIPEDVWEGLQANILQIEGFDTLKILKNIDMGGIGNQVGKVIIKLIIWYIGVALAAGTFGISLVVAFGVDELADELISDSNLDKKRKQRIRNKVAQDIKNHLIEKKSIMMDEFNETLEGQTKNADDIIDDALKTAFEIVTLKRFEM